MFLSLSNDLLLGIFIGVILSILFQLAQQWSSSAQRQMPCFFIVVLGILAMVFLYFWFWGG